MSWKESAPSPKNLFEFKALCERVEEEAEKWRKALMVKRGGGMGWEEMLREFQIQVERRDGTSHFPSAASLSERRIVLYPKAFGAFSESFYIAHEFFHFNPEYDHLEGSIRELLANHFAAVLTFQDGQL